MATKNAAAAAAGDSVQSMSAPTAAAAPVASAPAAAAPAAAAGDSVAVATGRGFYRVTLGDSSGVVQARDGNEAWALFCDGRKAWPSRKLVKPTVEFLGEEMPEDAGKPGKPAKDPAPETK